MRFHFFLSLHLLLLQPAYTQPACDSLLDRYARESQFSGAVLIGAPHRSTYLRCFGQADRQTHAPIRPDSRFRIASLTKTFTAVLILQLVEQGRVRLQEPIATYLPEYRVPAWDSVTVEHLLTYSSGLSDTEAAYGDSLYRNCLSAGQFIQRYCRGPLSHAPGTFFSYSNGDYILLGKIIERVTDASFASNLSSRILRPLHLRNTGFVERKPDRRLVVSYLYNDVLRRFTPDPPYCLATYFSAGAMYSSIEDLYRFDQAIFQHRLLKPETVQRMLTPHPTLDNTGLGFWVSGAYGPFLTTFAYRPGGIYGATANWIHVLGSDKVILVLSNSNAVDLFGLSRQLHELSGTP